MRWKPLSISIILVTLGLLAWYVLRPLEPVTLKPQPVAETTPSPEAPTPTVAEKTPEAPMPPVPATESPTKITIPTWELKIDEALRSQADHGAIAKSLLQQVPSMPPEGQHQAAQHIANLMADQDYLEVIPYIQNLKIASGFQEVIVAESLNRPKEVKLPVLLTAARTPMHPMKDTALSVLSVLLNENYGSDWGKWETAVQNAIKQPQ